MDNRRQHGGGTLNTFFFGVLIGVLLSLLFTTKRGRRLLKVITDEGVERISHWEDMLKSMEKEVEEDTFDEETVVGEDVEQEIRQLESPRRKEETSTNDIDDEEPLRSEKPEEERKPAVRKSRRLFKGIRKKAS